MFKMRGARLKRLPDAIEARRKVLFKRINNRDENRIVIELCDSVHRFDSSIIFLKLSGLEAKISVWFKLGLNK